MRLGVCAQTRIRFIRAIDMPKMQVGLPGIFTVEEIVTAFRDASTYQENSRRKWEARVEHGERTGVRPPLKTTWAYAIPLRLRRPNVVSRHLLGRGNTWRRINASSDEPEAKILISDCTGQDFYERSWESFVRIVLFVGGRSYLDLDDGYVVPYRIAYETIIRRFLEQLIGLAREKPEISAFVENGIEIVYMRDGTKVNRAVSFAEV